MKQIFILLIFITLALPGFSQSDNIYKDSLKWNNATVKAKGEAFDFTIAEDLPDVLIIGNSISIGYTPYVREFLKGKANIYRIPDNAGDTRKGLENIEMWLANVDWDVIHFNFGLHDLKYPDSLNINVSRKEYMDNLKEIIEILTKETNAKLVFATTTYVPEGCNNPRRDSGEEINYNAAALNVLLGYPEILIDDHYAITKNYPEEQRTANVHFLETGKQRQARQVSKIITEALNSYK